MSARPRRSIPKLDTLKTAARYFNSDLTSLVCRDKNGKLLSVTVHATASYAKALERWLKRCDKDGVS